MTTSNTSSDKRGTKKAASNPALIPGIPQPPSHPKLLQVRPESRICGQETERQLVKLHVFEGRSLRECARLMGRNYNALHAIWRSIVDDTNPDSEASENHRRSVRTYVDTAQRQIIQDSMPMVSKSAAHRALVIKAKKSIRNLHGVPAPEENETSRVASLGDIGARVRVVLPLMVGEIERVRALRLSAADAPL